MIGTLNYHKIYNYGALLQSYALREFLMDSGYDAYSVDYLDPVIAKQALMNDNAIFNNYISENVMCKVKSTNEVFDAVVYGSDTVWNHPNNIGEIDSIYLGDDQINAKIKIAYSASANMDVFDGEYTPDLFRSTLSNFNAISVREDVLQEYIQPLVDIPVLQTCDPTMLIAKEKWLSVAAERLFDSPYVFIYNQQFGDQVFDIAKAISKKTELNVYVLTGFNNSLLYDKDKNIIRSDISPWEFLSLIIYANKLYVASFHGLAFSIIFNKDFYTSYKSFGGSRMDSLLRLTNLESRFVEHSSAADFEKQIDWVVVNKKIKRHIESSKQFILTNLNETFEE